MRVLIIGGGIGGLTTALALRQRGLDAQVYEAAPQLHPLGAGIVVAINGMQVFRHLGLDAKIEAAGHRLLRARIADAQLDSISETSFATLENRHRNLGNISIHRARLQEILVNALPTESLHLGRRCVGVEQRGKAVVARFADSTEAEGDALIAADGLHSSIRHQIFADLGATIQPRYSGQTSWRGITAFSLTGDMSELNVEAWGGGGTRFGIVHVGHGQVYWFAVAEAAAGGRDSPGGVRETLTRRFASYHPLVGALIAATPDSNIVRTDISDLPHLPAWHRGRIALLGDAAHATTPNLGQGGNQAIEDGLCMAEQLAELRDPEAAFAAHFRARVKKTRFIVDASWRFGKVAHWQNPAMVAVRNFVLRHTPEILAVKQMERVVTLDFLKDGDYRNG